MSKFNMMDLLNSVSKEEVNKEKISEFKTININIKDIAASESNFYSVKEEDLKELKDSIEMLGLQQNLVVKRIDNYKYELIAGHRRFLALSKLYEEGNSNYEYIPCKVEEEDDIRNELRLIITNSTARELSEYEKIQQSQKLKELLIRYKEKEKLPGRVRELIADMLNTSESQVARMESISKNLSDEFKEELKDEKINFSVSYEISTLPNEKQKEVFEEYKEKGNVTLKDVKVKKEEVKEEKIEILEGQISVEEALKEEDHREEDSETKYEMKLRVYILLVKALNEHVENVAGTYLEGAYYNLEDLDRDLQYVLKRLPKIRELEKELLKGLNK